MNKKLFALFSLMLVAAFALSACGPSATQAPAASPAAGATEAPAEKVTITVWHSWKEAEIQSLNDVIAGFQAKNPNVTVDVLYVPNDDIRGKFETAAASGGGPTVMIGSADWGPAFFDAGLVSDVSGMAAADFLATINEAALGAVQYKGALVGLPQTIKGVVMYRNKTIIPEAPKTFEELLAAAKAATHDDVKGAALEYGLFFAAGHLYGLGGKLMTPEGDPAFNDAKGIEWANLIKSFKDAGPVFNNVDDDISLFKTGKVGIVIDGTWNMSSFSEAIGADNLSIDPWPAPLSGFVQTENIYLSANADEATAQAGWAFMEYFLSTEAQGLLADSTKAAHISAVSGVDVSDPLMQEAAAAFAGGVAFPVIPEMGAYWDPVNNALKKVVDENIDPATALQEAFDAVTAKVAEIRGGP
jgi:arabinogalactan oligomer/maltooligosaccharide transport system substrate-binding protein